LAKLTGEPAFSSMDTSALSTPIHTPVMVDEVLHWLDPRLGQTIIDGTLGGGGHTRALAERVGADGLVVGLDRDPDAVNAAVENLRELPVKLVQANFCDLPEVLNELQIAAVDAVLLDLGISSDQLADDERGFSFTAQGPLDLRLDPMAGEPAWRLIERLSAEHLANLIYEFGEERCSRRIARKIVETRRDKPIRTAAQLASIVRSCVPTGNRRGFDPATRTFQALRIAVNAELKSLDIALRRIPECLHAGGRLAVISFHSLEDRRVKTAFRDDNRYDVLTRKPIRPSQDEIGRNPRCRSSRLRVAQRAAD
jgi:16S rRNA (cytosine1402-N4)-methyltransferase